MEIATAELPDDAESLKAMVVELQGERRLSEARQHREVRKLIEQGNALRTRYEQQITLLREQLNLLLAKRYGVSSEKWLDGQFGLFNEAEDVAAGQDAEAPAPTTAVAAHTRNKRGRRPSPDTLPRVECIHDIADEDKHCPHDGTALEAIGEEVSEQLDIVPATVQVLRHIRRKYACPCCRGHVVTAPLPAQPIPKSNASPGLLAHVAISKYADALPLHRQERVFQRMGVDMPRATLAGWMIRAGALVQPVINLLRERLLEGAVIHCDETPVQVLKEAAKAATSRSYMWVQVSGRFESPVVLFDYDASRGGAIPKRLLGEFAGFLHTDGYEGYAAVCRANRIIQVGCWAHVRRKYDEVLKAAGINPKKPPSGTPPAKARRALKALQFLQRLFAIEHRIRDCEPEERLSVRQAESAPVVEALRVWLDATLPNVVPGSALGKALAYTDNQWPKLTRFLDDGRLELHNNRAENAIRPFVIGRRNWLFSDTVAGAKASANLYSLIETAKANGIEPYGYLRRLFTELPKATTVEEIDALLPIRNQDPSHSDSGETSIPGVA